MQREVSSVGELVFAEARTDPTDFIRSRAIYIPSPSATAPNGIHPDVSGHCAIASDADKVTFDEVMEVCSPNDKIAAKRYCFPSKPPHRPHNSSDDYLQKSQIENISRVERTKCSHRV